jgi:hypothetical protein
METPRSRSALVVSVLSLVVLGGIGVWIFAGNRPTPAPPPPPAAPPAVAVTTPPPTPSAVAPPPHPAATAPAPTGVTQAAAPLESTPSEIKPFDPKVPLESMLQRRPELIRMLKKNRESLQGELDKARADGSPPEDVHRLEVRLKRLDERVSELERRQTAGEPAH